MRLFPLITFLLYTFIIMKADVFKHSCVNCIKKDISLLKGLSTDELTILDSHRSCVNYKKGETIYKEGFPTMGLMCLNIGKAKVVRSVEGGQEHIVALKKPVDFIGFHELMGDSTYSTTAVALEETSICIIAKDDFFKVVEHNSSFAIKIIRQLAIELERSDQRAVNLTQKFLRARIAEALILIHDVFGTTKDDPGSLNVKLKRSEIASLSNVTTANVIRTLSAFSGEGLIETENKNIRILDLEGLNAISNGYN